MSYDTPMTAAGQAIQNLPVKEQLRKGLKDMGSRSFSSAKNFGIVGAMFSGTECCIEGVRFAVMFENIHAKLQLIINLLYLVSGQERHDERYSCWVHHWRCPRSESRPAGSRHWLCRFRSIQHSNRVLAADAKRELKRSTGYLYMGEGKWR